ncbi:MAG: GH36 C-terminal domain-containing protein, partial [Candidatus Omnitrophica bacterium]|nr:GH36 C-terminal domain-containing protein [Candidatus Omnitrophota bacterium]
RSRSQYSLSPVLGGNYFRPLPLPLNDHQWDAQQFQSADASRGILVVFRAKSQNDEQPVRWVHLQPKASYRVWDTAGNDTAVHTGEDLMSQGLLFSLPSEGSRLLGYEVTQVRSTPIPIPSAPPSLIVQATGPQSIRLSWPSVAGAMVYVIRRDGEVLARVTDAHEYCDRDLEPAQTCRYAVAAEAGLIRSPWTFGWGTTLNSQGATRVVRRPNLDLWEMIEADWRRQDKITDSTESCFHGLTNALARARLLLAELRPALPVDFVTQETGELDRLDQLVKTSNNKAIGWRGLYLRARWLNREIALANPLMDFGKLLFVKRIPTSYSHLVMQYFGWRARPGGGLFVAEKPGYSLEVRDLLDGRLASGSVLEPRLSPDAKRIVFSYSKCTPDDPFFHICEVHTDGTGFRQLTSGEYEDLMPEYLPDGGIIFSSTRRRGYARCFGSQFGKRWHVYALHRMGADGKNIRPLSFHDTNEWFPAVSNSGRVLYARWDYIDRDAVTHQNLWSIRPDGSDPMVVWGNATASPHCSFQAQPIPGSPKIVFTASAHHSMTAGSIVVLNPEVSIDGHQAITRITPEVCFPEAEGSPAEYYQSPWPLSENFFLVAYSPYPLLFEPAANEPAALGVYLLDRFGNRELIYRDPAIGSTSPMPLAPRPCPPICASTLPSQAPPTGEMILMNVYEGLGEIEHGTITALRIIQILPKTTPEADNPPVGLAREENARAILGTVKVESDGSAQFMVPAGKPLLFQALDKNGFAYQTMRTTTYVQPGERVSCIGCHESRLSAPRSGSPVLALRREPCSISPNPSHIEPEMDGTRPFSFVRLVQPILNRYCIQCHSGPKPELGIDLTAAPWRGFTRSYWSLCGDRDFWGNGTGPKNAAEALVPRFGGRNQIQVTPPGGVYGARGSRLMKLLRAGHAGLQLSPEEIRRLAIWIDANAVFYGVYDPIQQAVQLEGKAVPMPEVE